MSSSLSLDELSLEEKRVGLFRRVAGFVRLPRLGTESSEDEKSLRSSESLSEVKEDVKVESRKRARDDEDDWGQFEDFGDVASPLRTVVNGIFKRRSDGSIKVSRKCQRFVEFSVTPQLFASAYYLERFGVWGARLHVFWAVTHFLHAYFVTFGPTKRRTRIFSYEAHRILDYAFFITLSLAPLVNPTYFGPHALKFSVFFGVLFFPIFCFGFDPQTPEFDLTTRPRRARKRRPDAPPVASAH